MVSIEYRAMFGTEDNFMVGEIEHRATYSIEDNFMVGEYRTQGCIWF